MSENKKIAYIFPGQGAQYVGMGKDLYDKYAVAKQIFDKADKVLGFALTKLCFEGPIEELTKSAVCQPAILTHSIAAYQVLKTQLKDISPAACAGLSLGEYSALVASGSLKFEDAVSLVNKRGRFMDEASAQHPGTLSCILGLDIDKAEQVCSQSGTEIANLNCPGQIVVSGSNEAIKKAAELAQHAGAKRVIPLGVSGPFHSSLMQSAADKLRKELENVSIEQPIASFIPNVTADYEHDPQNITTLLTKQVASTTYWQKTIEILKNDGITIFIEMGPGKVLRGLLGRIDKQLEVFNLDNCSDFDKLDSFAGLVH
jgi:[acyl-carrier-protein] S-malonyltransferase